jgi:LuxR family transcriptional regulator, maltose regulon positive regulatory protein
MSTGALLSERPAAFAAAGGGERASTFTFRGRPPDPGIASTAAPLRYQPESPGSVSARRGIVPRRRLFERLDRAGRVTVVSGPAGSGKTVLLRSWTGAAGLAERTAWIPVHRDERDPQRFWISVISALRRTAAGSGLVQGVAAAPELDGWTLVERLLADLGSLADPIWLVIDDLHELNSTETLRQLELFLADAPATLRLVFATRQDLRIGLHRLRLRGELTEIRAADLRFTVAESRELLELAGARLPDPVLAALVQRTEGWAAGLRLAALSMTGHPDPECFAAGFSGCERTVAEYLLAEVLQRQPEHVRRLLLRTSILERVNGPLADVLTGGSGGERVLHDLEEASAFVVSLDAGRSWFRYHRLFADLLQLELRRSEPGQLANLHGTAAEWFTRHGYPVEAVRHAQAAGDWALAARVLSDHWFTFQFNGQAATAHDLLSGFPAGMSAVDPELAALMAADKLNRGFVPEAERLLSLATQGAKSVPEGRRRRLQVMLAILRLSPARGHRDLPAAIEEARGLLAPAGAAGSALPESTDVRALALISLGTAELRARRLDEAERHLEQGVALARRSARPWLEITGLSSLACLANYRSFALSTKHGMRAVELARQQGWDEEPIAALAYEALAGVAAWQGRLEEAEQWLERMERVRTGADTISQLLSRYVRGLLELGRGRNAAALAAFQAGERLAEALTMPHPLVRRLRAFTIATLVRMGETEHAARAFTQVDNVERETAEMRCVQAALRLAQNRPRDAAARLAPVLDGAALRTDHSATASTESPAACVWLIQAFLLEATARETLGEADAARRAVERASDLAEPEGIVLPFLLNPAPELLQRQQRHLTPYPAPVSEGPSAPASTAKPMRPVSEPRQLREPLSQAETRVLRYLPTNLSAPEIACELSVSVSTVRTHMRNLFAKLGAHRRTEAVERARAHGLLTPRITSRK